MRKIIVGLLALGVAACDCGAGTKKNAPILEVLTDDGSMERTSIDFGFVQVNTKGTQKIRVRNPGNALLTISEAASTPAQFGVDSPLPFEVAAGGEEQFIATFTPTVADQRVVGTLKLTTNDQTRPTFEIMVAGQGVTAVARVSTMPPSSPTTIAFGDVYVGEMKTVQLILTNAGGNALQVIGASVTGSPPGVTGNFTNLTNMMVPSGESVTVPVTFAPMAPAAGQISGAVEIQIDAALGGNVTVPITGRATEALARMCFKFDDTGVETCTDQITTSLDVKFGPQCDNVIYSCPGASAQRTGKFYFKNEGNVPLSYAVQYRPYIYTGSQCPGDAGAPMSDFSFSNVPVPDGGVPSALTQPTTRLPMAETDLKPWQSAEITITYRAGSRCVGEGTEQAQILWTRQCPSPADPKDPNCSANRPPATLFATLTGSSLLPLAKPKPVNIGQMLMPADVPLTTSIAVELVTNQGVAPLTLNSVELWEELPAYLPDGGTYDGGGPEGGILSMCNPSSPAYEFSDCARFQWAPGQSPADLLPKTLDGGASQSMPTQTVVGKLFVGCLADGGSCPPAVTRYKVIAIVNTSDPYASRVAVPIITYAKFLP